MKYVTIKIIWIWMSVFSFIHINLISSQSTVHLQSTEEGRGIVKSRGNEYFIIAPDHLFPRKSSEKVIISGDNQKISRGKYIQSYPADIAIVRIESGADQECKEWKTVQNYNSLLEKTNEGYIEIRNDDGSYDHEPMYLKSKSMSGITISPKDNSFEFSKGMSGSSLFTNLNGEKVYLGMLLSVDEENSRFGNVFQADDMERIMQEFFQNENSKANIELSAKNSIITIEEDGFKFDLTNIKKTGERVTVFMKVTSLNADSKIEIKRNNTKLFDYNGGFSDATYLKISGKTEYNTVGGSDFTFTKGIAVPVEIVFKNVSESDGVALLELNVNKGGYKVLKFKDINYQK